MTEVGSRRTEVGGQRAEVGVQRVDSRRLKVAAPIDAAVAVEAILRATIYNPDFDASIWSVRQGEELIAAGEMIKSAVQAFHEGLMVEVRLGRQ